MRRAPCPEVICEIVLGRQGNSADFEHIPLREVTWVHWRGPFLKHSFDRNIVIRWRVARSVMRDTVLPSLLPLDIIWLLMA